MGSLVQTNLPFILKAYTFLLSLRLPINTKEDNLSDAKMPRCNKIYSNPQRNQCLYKCQVETCIDWNLCPS